MPANSSTPRTTVASTKSGYLPSLDGWRSIAIVGVLLTHDVVRRVGPVSDSFFHRFGGYGVQLFFSISGLLICTRLLEEERLVGRIDLKGFYIRRVLRIQPAALVYLAAVAILTLIGWVHQSWRLWLGALLLYRNYLWNGNSDRIVADGILTGHFWTLAVEEHFYILLSILLVGLARRWRLRVMIAFALCLNFWEHFSVHRPALYTPGITERHTEQVLNFLLIPAIYAVLLQRPRIRAFALRWLHPWSTALAAVLVYALIFAANSLFFYPHLHRLVYSSRPEFMVTISPFLIISTMLHPRSWATRLLELPLFRHLGRWSYSLYLWHAIFFFRQLWPESIPAPGGVLAFVNTAPWKYIFSLTFAIVSFYLVEKPFMRLGHRIAPPATPGREDLGAESVHTSPPAQLGPTLPV